MFIKCRTKEKAQSGVKKLNKNGFNCYTDEESMGYGYNILGFKSSQEISRAMNILNNNKK
jgi:hypothetical protein